MQRAGSAKRMRHVPGGAPGLRLTERDVAIVQAIARYRFLRTDMIGRAVALDGFDAGSVDDPAARIRDRLTELFHGRFLIRPRAGFTFDFPGSAPMIYGLGREGERLLQNTDAAPARSDRRKDANATRHFIDHQLATNAFELALRECIAQRPDLSLAVNDDIALLPTAKTAKHPLRFTADARLATETKRIGIVPDLAFTLTSGNRTHAYFVEIDRSTEPAVRTNGRRTPTLKGTSILRKMIAYAALRRSGEVERRFGWRNFKVLFVCEPRMGHGDRIARLMRTARNHLAEQSGLFLFAPTNCDDVLGSTWQVADGTTRAIDPTLTPLLQRTG